LPHKVSPHFRLPKLSSFQRVHRFLHFRYGHHPHPRPAWAPCQHS
jgi:hypothetical protein